MSHVVFPIVWALALAVFAVIITLRLRLLLRAQPAARFDHLGARVKRMVVDGIGQRKFLSGEQPAGIMHALIFWGFVVLMLQVITLFGRALRLGLEHPGLRARPAAGAAVLHLARCARGGGDRRLRVHALSPADRPHAPPVWCGARGAALSRRAALGGEPDPRLHHSDHARRPAVRRREPRRQQHSRQRA